LETVAKAIAVLLPLAELVAALYTTAMNASI